MERTRPVRVTLCKCGCGEATNLNRTWLKGHDKKKKPWRPKQCECGCGELVKWPQYSKFYPGHNNRGKCGIESSHFGMKRSEETKLKISNTKKGRKASQQARLNMSKARSGKNHPFYGRPRSEETRRRISESNMGKRSSVEHLVKISGSNHWNWKGGISSGGYCPIWLDIDYKKSILERDDHSCQNPFCWGTSHKLSRHHINHDRMDCRPMNIITLCVSCNTRANGSKEYPKEFWENLYGSVVRCHYTTEQQKGE